MRQIETIPQIPREEVDTRIESLEAQFAAQPLGLTALEALAIEARVVVPETDAHTYNSTGGSGGPKNGFPMDKD